jgi:hypothetical protein
MNSSSWTHVTMFHYRPKEQRWNRQQAEVRWGRGQILHCGSRKNSKSHHSLHDSQAQLCNNAGLLHYLTAWLIELLSVGSNVSHIKLCWCHTTIKVVLKPALQCKKTTSVSNDLDTCEAKRGIHAAVKGRMLAHCEVMGWRRITRM